MNIHEVARKILSSPELPSLQGAGLCYLLSMQGAGPSAYNEMEELNPSISYLPCPGSWTEQRFNLLCLIAVTSPEDFK